MNPEFFLSIKKQFTYYIYSMKKSLKILLKIVIALFVFLNIVVMFHAYKFTHHYDIGQVVVKEEKDKTGWDRTKEMLFGFNMVKQKNIAPDSAFKTVKITTADKTILDAWYTVVPNEKGCVAMFHGHAGKKSSMLLEASEFQKQGYSTLMVDLRAHGNSSGNRCSIGFYEGEDVKACYDYLAGVGTKNIVLYGISLGASSITKAMNDYDILPTGIILEMPFGTLPEAVEGRVKMMGLPAQPIATMLTFWGGIENGFWAFGMKPTEYVKKIKCPVLLQWGKNDPRVSSKEIDEIFANISSTKKLVVYDSSAHQSLCSNENGKWKTEVAAFLPK
jgi:uncharacterized protein